MVLLISAEFGVDPIFCLSKAGKGILRGGKLFFDLLLVFGSDTGTKIATTLIREQCIQTIGCIAVFPADNGSHTGAGLGGKLRVVMHSANNGQQHLQARLTAIFGFCKLLSEDRSTFADF